MTVPLDVLRYLYPDAVPLHDYYVRADGTVEVWRVRDAQGQPVPPPTPADLEAAAASPEYAAWVLRRAQDARAALVDARTAELQAAGFEFPPGSGQRFSLTDSAMGYWTAMMVAAGVPGMLSYPVNAGVVGDGVYPLADASAVAVFCSEALRRGRAVVEGGADKKREVYAAQTVEAVAAVVDNRE